MNVSGSNNVASGMALLKKANEQPKIALDLITKTMQGAEQAQKTQQTAAKTSVSMAQATGKGQIVDIKA